MSRRGGATAAIFLAAAAAAQAFDAVTGAGVYWHHDLRHHHHPWRDWAADRWASGEIPLWCADVANGFPLMADGQVGAFYPGNVVLGALFASHRALTLGIVLHFWWAGLGAYWLCRVLGRSRPAGMVAGLGYMLSGFMVAHATYAGMHAVAAWAPWAIGAALLCNRRDDWRPAAAWALSVACVLTAGHVQGAAIALLGCLFAFAAEARKIGAWVRAGAGAALGILAASPQLAASLELADYSAREGGVDPAFAGIGSLPPQEILNAILPRFWGWERPADIAYTYMHKGPLYFSTGENHWEDCFYLGIPIVALATAGLFIKGQRRWKVMGVGALLLMLGRFTPVYALFRLLPGFSYFRFPVRFSMLLTIATAVLAAWGLDQILQRFEGRATRWFSRVAGALTALFLVLATGGGLVLRAIEQDLRGFLMGPLGERPGGLERIDALISGMMWNTSPTSPGVWLPALLLAVAAGAVWAYQRQKLSGAALGAIALASVFVDMTAFGSSYNPRVPTSEVVARPATVDVVTREQGLYRTSVVDRVQPPELDKELMSSSLGLLYGTRDVILLSPLILPRNEALLAAAGLDVGMEHGVRQARLAEERMSLLELLGVRYLITVHEMDHPRLELAHEGEDVRVYRNDSAQARAFLVGCAEGAPDWEAAMETLLAIDPRTTAVIEGVSDPACGAQPGSASIRSYADEEIQIDVSAASDGWLVLTDTWYPGWTAYVDGQETEILKADVTFRAVPVGAGAQKVVFRYEPGWAPLVQAGIGAWGLIGILAVVAGVGWRKESLGNSGD